MERKVLSSRLERVSPQDFTDLTWKKQVSGSWLVSFLKPIDVAKLQKAFGPEETPGDKTEYEWFFIFKAQDGTEVAVSIYDYEGDKWHLGGNEATEKHVDEVVAELQSLVPELKKLNLNCKW